MAAAKEPSALVFKMLDVMEVTAKFVVVALVVVELVISTLVSPVRIARLGSVVVEDNSRNTLSSALWLVK